jgi:hypothetical protein
MTSDRQQIEAVLQTYMDGLYENDTAKIARTFHEVAHLFSVEEGKLVDQPRTEWIAKMSARQSAKSTGVERSDWIVTIDQSGPATAFAKVNCQLPPRYFTDYLSLAKIEGEWRIVSKTFHTVTR